MLQVHQILKRDKVVRRYLDAVMGSCCQIAIILLKSVIS